jgi:hypothetical protein
MRLGARIAHEILSLHFRLLLPWRPGKGYYRKADMNSEVMLEIEELVEEYRDQCLWFLRRDFVPRTTEEALRVLDLIERYGDRASFQRTQRLKQWLLLPTSAKS